MAMKKKAVVVKTARKPAGNKVAKKTRSAARPPGAKAKKPAEAKAVARSHAPARPHAKPHAAGKLAARPHAAAKSIEKAHAPAKPEAKPLGPVKATVASKPPAAKGGGRELAFKQLRAILVPYAKRLQLKRDQPDVYYLDAAYSEEWKREVFFGAVRSSAAYVSFHLMPVYVFPELLKGLSPALKKRMQGKSCFNFTDPDKVLFAELEKLTAAGYDLFRKAGLA